MPHFDDLSRCLVPLVQGDTLIAVVEMSLSSWLVSGLLPSVDRKPLKKLVFRLLINDYDLCHN